MLLWFFPGWFFEIKFLLNRRLFMDSLVDYNSIHMVGIKGVGMSALAQILKALGFKVRGSDTEEQFFTDRILEQAGIEVLEGFSPDNLNSAVDLVVISAAYLKNPAAARLEIKEIKKRGLSVLSYAQAVGAVFNQARQRVAVAGTHGKSTTTAMIGELLTTCEKDFFSIVGTEVLRWKSNAFFPFQKNIKKKDAWRKLSESSFLLEADEYQRSFLNYCPSILVLTDVDYDHPDCYQNLEEYEAAFDTLIESMIKDNSNRPLVVGSPEIKKIRALKEKFTGRIEFASPGKRAFGFDLKIPGDYNKFNASLAYTLAQKLKLDTDKAEEALRDFKGTRRRFEQDDVRLGEKEIVFVDDYAHHPKEIKAVLRAVKEHFASKKLAVVFQPHTFSRTEEFFEDFVEALSGLRELILVPTYGSQREEKGKCGSRELYSDLSKKGEEVVYCSSLQAAAEYLQDSLKAEDVVLTLGAGDVWKIKNELKS